MKQGIEYAHSNEKRLFDLTVAGATTPLIPVVRTVLIRNLRDQEVPEHRTPFFEQQRVGSNGIPFIIRKFRTLDTTEPTSERPLTEMTRRLRGYGLDELPQIYNIMKGEMSVIGHRALMGTDILPVLEDASIPANLREEWRSKVLPTRPGAISTFSVLNHAESRSLSERGEEMLELDIKDVVDGSLVRDVNMLASTLASSVLGRLQEQEFLPEQ